MIAIARARYLRVSPVKIRQVIDMIRGKDVPGSQAILTHINKGSAKMIHKVLHSAVANAKLKGLSEEQLFVSKIHADSGPMWKRFRAAAFGRASSILKRTTHLTIELDLRVPGALPVVRQIEQPQTGVKPEPKTKAKSGRSQKTLAASGAAK